MIYFLGDSHAPKILKQAAKMKGLPVTENINEAELVFVSQDTPTDEYGRRDLALIRNLVHGVVRGPTVVLTSQVPPGFTRSFKRPMYHMAETLRIKDALDRALSPEQFIIGCDNPEAPLPPLFCRYLQAFGCPVLRMTFEEAEFTKIAINNILISQVDTTNRLARIASKLGARWGVIARALHLDRRIGPYAYLEQGQWTDSKHLLRDHVTLRSL